MRPPKPPKAGACYWIKDTTTGEMRFGFKPKDNAIGGEMIYPYESKEECNDCYRLWKFQNNTNKSWQELDPKLRNEMITIKHKWGC